MLSILLYRSVIEICDIQISMINVHKINFWLVHINKFDTTAKCSNVNHAKKLSNAKHGLTYHVNHKVCVKPDQICPQCGHQFASRAMLQYHLEHVTCQKVKPTKEPSKEELLLKVAILEEQVKVLSKNQQNTINQIIIFPQTFGTEDIQPILAELPNLLHEAVTTYNS